MEKNFISKLEKFFLKNQEKVILFLILLIASFLRFYKLKDFQFFTYDQARDYLIIKKMIIDHKFTLVGPTVLAPGVYLPPFYYYSLAPFLYFFKFHLLGQDIYTAIMGIGAVVVFYLLSKDLFTTETALITTLLFSLNPYLIQASRHAWNPNTIYFFTLLFALSFERYLIKKKSRYLLLASFAFSWSLNLHYTVLVFLPLLIFLFYKEYSEGKKSKNLLLSATIFVFFISPLFIFELRHNFPNFRGLLNFVAKQTDVSSPGSNFFERLKFVFTDFLKMPITLLLGLNQGHNLTVNPSHILLFDRVVFELKSQGRIFICLLSIVWGLIVIVKRRSKFFARMIFAFLFFGFLIRLVFPPSSFYFYHYTFLFPFVFLFPCLIFDQILSKNPKLFYPLFFLVLLFSFLLVPVKLKNEIKSEEYFLPTGEIIAQDVKLNQKPAIAANLSDSYRWDHNGLEYRYFLETKFNLRIGGWEEKDYRTADALYLIDEGDLKEPLMMGGMEMEAFKPNKVEKTWQVKTGQRIYKMTREKFSNF